MSTRPKGSLDDLTVPKGGQVAAPVPAEPDRAQPPANTSKAYAHTLSLRLTAEQYRRLRRFVAAREDATGERMTHQGIIEAALSAYLDRENG